MQLKIPPVVKFIARVTSSCIAVLFSGEPGQSSQCTHTFVPTAVYMQNLMLLCTKEIQCSLSREQMTSSDKDFRFMATNDLMSELQKDSIKLDDDSERKVCHTWIIDGLMCLRFSLSCGDTMC